MPYDERHDEHREGRQSVRKPGFIAALNLVGFVVELVGGLVFGSVALLGDALHMLFDAVAYLLALGAAVVAAQVDPSDQWSYGLHRIEPFAAFLNGTLLVPMVGVLLLESYRRYLSPIEIDTRATILLAGGGLPTSRSEVPPGQAPRDTCFRTSRIRIPGSAGACRFTTWPRGRSHGQRRAR